MHPGDKWTIQEAPRQNYDHRSVRYIAPEKLRPDVLHNCAWFSNLLETFHAIFPRGQRSTASFGLGFHNVSLSSASRNLISKCSPRDIALPTSYTTSPGSAVLCVCAWTQRAVWQRNLKTVNNHFCFLPSTHEPSTTIQALLSWGNGHPKTLREEHLKTWWRK